jgi:hypothetical protein
MGGMMFVGVEKEKLQQSNPPHEEVPATWRDHKKKPVSSSDASSHQASRTCFVG